VRKGTEHKKEVGKERREEFNSSSQTPAAAATLHMTNFCLVSIAENETGTDVGIG